MRWIEVLLRKFRREERVEGCGQVPKEFGTFLRCVRLRTSKCRIEQLTVFTMTLVFLSQSAGTLYRPLYSLSSLKYTSCKYSLPNNLSTVAPGYSLSSLGNTQPGQPLSSPFGYGFTMETSMISVRPFRCRTRFARCAKGQNRPGVSRRQKSLSCRDKGALTNVHVVSPCFRLEGAFYVDKSMPGIGGAGCVDLRWAWG